MTAVVVFLMALGLAAAVGYPLWKGVEEDALPAFAAELVVQDSVAYTDPDELALDRALGRVGSEAEAMTMACVDLEEELERRVTALRRGRPTAPAPTAAMVAQPAIAAAGNCPQCGHSYDPGDLFCSKCGQRLSTEDG